jgi:hypothetical protein
MDLRLLAPNKESIYDGNRRQRAVPINVGAAQVSKRKLGRKENES